MFYQTPVYDTIQWALRAVDFVGSNLQALFHTAIAANRFTAFYFPLEYDSIWTPRVVRAVILILIGIAIALGIGSFPVLALTQCYCIDENADWDSYKKQMASEGLIGTDFYVDVVSFVYVFTEKN